MEQRHLGQPSSIGQRLLLGLERLTLGSDAGTARYLFRVASKLPTLKLPAWNVVPQNASTVDTSTSTRGVPFFSAYSE